MVDVSTLRRPADVKGLIRVCEWVSEEVYKLLLTYLDYVGRSHGCSLFRVNEFKMARNLEHVDELIELVKKYADNYMEGLEVIENALRKVKSVELALDESSRLYIIRSSVRLSSYLLGVEGVKYSPQLRAFTVRPYALVDVLERLRAHGFNITDRTGLLECSELAGHSLRVELRPYQREALSRWMKRRQGVVALPTGSGKTIVALAAIVATGCPTLIVVYTREQLMQWYEKLLELTSLTKVNVGVFYGERKELKHVTVTTYQSAVKHLNLMASRFKLLVVDEAHHLPAQKFRTIATGILAPYRLGLSATPYRDDGLHEELFRLMGGLVYYKSFEELAREGYVAAYELIVVRVKMSQQEKLIYRRLMDELKKYPKLDEMLAANVDYSDVAKAYKVMADLRRFLTSMESKIRALKTIVSEELSRGSKIIIFAEYVDLAKRVSNEVGGLLLTGKLNDRIRESVLRRFRQAGPSVLVTTTVGDEGLDVIDATTGIILTSLVSQRQFKQRLGRLLRPKEGKVARLYVLVARGTFEERRLVSKLLENDIVRYMSI